MRDAPSPLLIRGPTSRSAPSHLGCYVRQSRQSITHAHSHGSRGTQHSPLPEVADNRPPLTPANDTPVADAQSVTTNEDTAAAITLTGSDIDGDTLTFIVVSGPANGSLSGAAPNLTYTPSADFNGSDSFTFKVNDGSIDSSLVTVSTAVTAVNDAPVAVGDSYSLDQDTTFSVAA